MDHWWILLAIFIVIVIYRTLSSGPRKAVLVIARALNIQPGLVDEMLAAMGPERGNLYVAHINHDPHNAETIAHAVQTVYVFRIFIKNQHPSEIAWWRNRLLEKGFNATLGPSDLEFVAMYLKNIGIEKNQIQEFLMSQGLYRN